MLRKKHSSSPFILGTVMTSLKDRIRKHVTITKSGCWLWGGAVVSNRYPALKVGAKMLSVRRLVYDLWKLKPAMGNCTVRTTCLQDRCICPAHLVRSKRGKGGSKPKAHQGPGRGYPWLKWFKKARWELRRGQDYSCAPHSMAMQIRQQAHKRQVPVSVTIDEETLHVLVGGKR